MKKGKTGIFVVIGALILLAVLIFPALTVRAEENRIIELKPSAAIERALEHSLKLKMAEINLDNAEIDYEGRGVIGDRQRQGIISRMIAWLF